MSHYSVAVFTNNNSSETAESLLEPYYEGLSVPHYITKQELIVNSRQRTERERNSFYKDYLKNPDAFLNEYKNSPSHISYVTKELPKKFEWTDEEHYKNELSYYEEEQIKEDGSVFEDYNPNSKWDWYEIGGRFSDTIPLKDGGFTDEADMCDVKIDNIDKEQYNRAKRFWELYVDGAEPENEEETKIVKHSFYRVNYYRDRWDSAEDYAEDCSGFGFYSAVMPDGEWLEAGSMGWFGMSAATPDDEKAWRKKTKDILKKAQEENWHITIVDCHI